MKAALSLAGLTLLLTTLVEGSVFRHQSRRELKKPLTHALRKTNRKTPSGKIIVDLFFKTPKILVGHHFNPEDCTADCSFELQLSLELCKQNETVVDEDSLRGCLESLFSPDSVSKFEYSGNCKIFLGD